MEESVPDQMQLVRSFFGVYLLMIRHPLVSLGRVSLAWGPWSNEPGLAALAV
jgi:hypothetical protein